MDLTDPSVREDLTERLLATLYGDRPVLLGPGILAGYTGTVAELRARGNAVLVLSTGRGAGPVPDAADCTVVEIALPPTTSMTEELRVLDRIVRHLPPDVVAAIDAFDPARVGTWIAPPFVTDEPILGRPVTGGRPASHQALEDKMRADAVWAAAGVTHAPHRLVECDPAALAEATADLATDHTRGLGVVWSGDARDGVNGGGNFVRWVADASDQAAAFAFFAPRCDRVRVMPFLDGVPCSVHGIVLPDGTAVFRPVELAILRDPAQRRFVYGGLGTWWDPPRADRDAMRDVARRVGAHLATAYGYRGAFGIDGVLTVDGFRPTELNTRLSAGVATIGRVAPALFTTLNAALVAGHDPSLTVDDLEALVPLMDAERQGRASAVGQGVSVGGSFAYRVTFTDGRLERVDDEEDGSELVVADTPVGFFAKVELGALLEPGHRLAPLNVALLAHLDATYGTGFGPLEAAPDLRG